MRKPTLHDVARAAGVSYATADRVLNARGGVAEKSILRVRQAIEDLGYQRDLHAANLSRQRNYLFRFYLPGGDHSFFRVLRAAVEAERPTRAVDRIGIEIHEMPAMDGDALASALEAVAAGACDCVALVAIDTPRIVAAMARLRRLGIAVVTLVADAGAEAVAARAAYVGIDNLVAGRTAGRLMTMAHRGATGGHAGGQVLPIIGAHTQRDHRDRLAGAAEVLATDAPGVALLPALVVQDSADRMRPALQAALADGATITGIYSIGAGNRALVEILRGLGPLRPFVVLHELTPVSRAALEAGLIDAVIDQNPALEAAQALDAMKALADGLAPPQVRITPGIYLKDNLPISGARED